MSKTLADHAIPDQLPIKGHDSQYTLPSDGKLYGPSITNTEDLPIQYQEGKLDHYSDDDARASGGGAKPGLQYRQEQVRTAEATNTLSPVDTNESARLSDQYEENARAGLVRQEMLRDVGSVDAAGARRIAKAQMLRGFHK